MNQEILKKARHFIENETQFHLGFLPTEQSNRLTANLDMDFQAGTVNGVQSLQRVDRNVLAMVEKIFAGAELRKLVETGEQTLKNGGRIVFSGCGATGRLSILLEGMWRAAAADTPYADAVFSIMTGGDYALVRSLEFFEDYTEFGRQQVREMGMTSQDMLVAITEGGETSSVLGTVDEALRRGAAVFLLFNNPAELLAERLERSRQAIANPKVCVLDLSCGPMALAGSTRMQATTSEQLVAGGALEMIFGNLFGISAIDYAAAFGRLLDELEAPAARTAIAAYIDFEAEVYRQQGKITYFADDFMLDIFTDTTERSPTFMLPPFRKNNDRISPQSWAFVKNPLYDTPATWQRAMRRSLRCLEWTAADYERMGAAAEIKDNPPLIQKNELLKFEVGNESSAERYGSDADTAILVSVGIAAPELAHAFKQAASGFKRQYRLAIGASEGDFAIPLTLSSRPLRLMDHMAIKLVLNTISTGTMVCLGRVTGNWMSWVDVTNKKLLDRGIRLLAEIGKLDYEAAALLLFESIEALAASNRPGGEKPSAVQHALQKLRRQTGAVGEHIRPMNLGEKHDSSVKQLCGIAP